MSRHEIDEGGTQPALSDSPTVVPKISTTRLHVIVAGLWLSLFISAMDTTIITTALIKISSGFNALDRAAWLVSTYLLTYNAFLVISAKLSDVFGLKSVLIASNLIFLVFSMACSGAQTMTQLTIFRALQGIGGSGMYSLVFVSIMKLTPPAKLGLYSGIISSVFALANLLGPVLGGVIADRSTWRWIFWINGPIIATALVLLSFSMPGIRDGKSNRDRLRDFDVVGGILSVCWPIPLLFALQEGGVQYEWDDAIIIGTLTAGIAGFLLFGAYEAFITYWTKNDAIVPFRLFTNPAMALLILNMLLLGFSFYASFVQLPQRFQAVNHTTAERAGILLLPLALLTPVGAVITGITMGKYLAAEYILIIGTAIICVGTGLISSLPVDSNFWTGTYGYEIIIGFGLGLASPPYYFLLYTSVDEKDVAVGTGTLNMSRTLGGCVAIAICSALHNSILRNDLPGFLTVEQIALVETSNTFAATLAPELQTELGETFGKSYNRQFQVILAVSGLNLLIAIALGVIRKRKGIFGVLPQIPEETNIATKTHPLGDTEVNGGKEKEQPNQMPVTDSSATQQTGSDVRGAG